MMLEQQTREFAAALKRTAANTLVAAIMASGCLRRSCGPTPWFRSYMPMHPTGTPTACSLSQTTAFTLYD